MTIYSGFSHWKWWCSIVMLVYQRVFRGVYSIISACLMVKYVKSPWKSPLIPIHLHVRPANFGVPHFRTKPLIVRYCWLGWFHYIHIVSPCVHMLNIEYGKSSRFYVFQNSITITQFYPMISSWYSTESLSLKLNKFLMIQLKLESVLESVHSRAPIPTCAALLWF